MRLFRRKSKEVSVSPDDWNSPFDGDVIREGDPGWDVFLAAMKSGGPVVGTYNAVTGDIVSIRCEHDNEVWFGHECGECETPNG